MSLLKGLNKGIAAPAVERDSVGATLLESGVYGAEITMAYLQKSSGGALGAFITFKTDDGKQVRMTQYITSGNDKGNKPTYTDKDGNEAYLPGYLIINSLTLLAVGKELHEVEDEEKVVKLYNFEAKADVATKVQVMTELIGAKIKIGVVKQIVSKKVKDGNGVYVATAETREENEVVKLFRDEDSMTTAEILAEKEEATFINDWIAKFEGKVLDKTSKDVPAAGSAAAGKPLAAKAPAAKPSSSLFKKPAAPAATTEPDA